jgi:hypothetical protein
MFVWHMEDVLELYEEPYDPKRPIVCFDEMPYQMVAEKRTPLPQKPGRLQRYDYEYERKGTANIFCVLRAQASMATPGRHRETYGGGFRLGYRRLVDEHYPTTEKVRVVLDNLNTHTPASLYKAFEPEEARRILRRPEFHNTPKHASWLNMVEIELSVLSRQCLERRIPDAERLAREIGAWEQERNEGGATVQWRFTASDAREKLARLSPAQP